MGVSKELLMRRRNLGSPHIATATGAVATFAGNMAAPFKELTCEFTPVQSGSGDPSPSNVRPISGWSGGIVRRCGRNLFHTEWEKGSINGNTGEYITTNQRLRTKNFLRLKTGTRYVINLTADSSTAGYGTILLRTIFIYNLDGTLNRYENLKSSFPVDLTLTPQGDDEFVLFNMTINYSSGVAPIDPSEITNTIVEEIPSGIPTYESYTGNDYALDWFNIAGTVYGGNVDPVRGVLRAEFYSVTKTWGDFGNKTSLGSNTRGTLSLASNPSTSLGPDAKCNVAPRATGYSVDACHFYTDLDACIMVLPNDTADSTEIQVVYPLATPITYQLTPQIIKSLKTGTNNVFSSLNGNTMVKYWKH